MVFVGAMIPRKGADVAMEACRIARAARTNISLDLYGSGQSADYHPNMDGARYLGSIPLAVSRRAGAAVLVERSGAGFLFDPADPAALAEELKRIAAQLEILDTWGHRALAYNPLIAPEVAVVYIRDCLRHVLEKAPRSVPLWCSAIPVA